MKKTTPNTKKQKLADTPSPAPANIDCQEFILALEKLNQPWNWVVQAFIRLLQEPNAKRQWAPRIKNYTYSQTPLKDGRWFFPESSNAQHGPVPLGIVIKNSFEVSVRDSWNHGNDTKQRLIPVAMLGPGALFGAFEFCDSRASVPSLRDYEVSAGSRAFKIVPKGEPISKPTGPFFLSLGMRCLDWREGRADHDELIRDCEHYNSWQATILLLTQTPLNLTSRERDLLDVVQNEAWRQSRHLREGHLRWLRHDVNPEQKVKKLSAATSKFKRKIELTLIEECLVFGNPNKPEEFGPFSLLIRKINPMRDEHNQLQISDILVPLLLNDIGSPSYVSFSDDALVFGTRGLFPYIRSTTETIAKSCRGGNKMRLTGGTK